ncbi:MAG: VWA domain-containing protein [Thermodesulfobacteriota bacterium]|nr:VWA domain-containing protein [Thermodesulfobacteriota bacterium]
MKKTVLCSLTFIIMLAGCTDTKKHSKGVYLLLDASGTHASELEKAQSILNDLLLSLNPLDTLAVARVDTENFDEKDVIAKVTFHQRPSIVNNQKRAFHKKIGNFISQVKNSRYTDISGGIFQAVAHLNEVDPGHKFILIFSDLREELKQHRQSDVPFQLVGFKVIALNVTTLRANIRDPIKYMEQVEQWGKKIEKCNGQWHVADDLDRLDHLFMKSSTLSGQHT